MTEDEIEAKADAILAQRVKDEAQRRKQLAYQKKCMTAFICYECGEDLRIAVHRQSGDIECRCSGEHEYLVKTTDDFFVTALLQP